MTLFRLPVIAEETTKRMGKPEDHWSFIAHLSAEDMLKSDFIEEKKVKILNLSNLDEGQ